MLTYFGKALSLILIFGGFLSGCSTPKPQDNNKLTVKQLQAGLLRILALTDENLDLDQIKEIYKEDFEESSKRFNPETKATEYKVYPYGRKNPPLFMGFDEKKRYVYTVGEKPSKSGKPPKILWAKDAQALYDSGAETFNKLQRE